MIQVLGVRNLDRDFDRLKGIASSTETRRAFRAGAAVLRDAARTEAPRGTKRGGSRNPGLLKRAIVSFLGRRRRKGEDIVSFARVNVLKGRVRAPHAHLIEFGTSERRAKSAKFMTFRINGQVVRRRTVRGVTANPYFERAVSRSGGRVLDAVTASLRKQIEGK
jgi:HK97 gp10 family phage protein